MWFVGCCVLLVECCSLFEIWSWLCGDVVVRWVLFVVCLCLMMVGFYVLIGGG